jgi:hypothetical protein
MPAVAEADDKTGCAVLVWPLRELSLVLMLETIVAASLATNIEFATAGLKHESASKVVTVGKLAERVVEDPGTSDKVPAAGGVTAVNVAAPVAAVAKQ